MMMFLPYPLSSSFSFNHPHCYFEQKKPPLLHCHVTNSSSPPLQPHFMVDFLTTNCGFSSDKAAIKASSKDLSHLTSPDRPNSFVAFMRSHGFNESQIKKIVSSDPTLLCYDADKTFSSHLKSLKDIGFSGSDIDYLINSTPTVLHFCTVEQVIKKRVNPNISLLRERGISHKTIAHAMTRNPAFIRFLSPEEMAAAIDHIEKKLGIVCHSKYFMRILSCYIRTGKDKFDAKFELMKSFGWSEEEFISALCKQPNFVLLSEEMLMRKMSFLVKEAGCTPLEVAQDPALVAYSLQNRLIPRHRVIEFLRSQGLIRRECKLVTIMKMASETFMRRYVIPHKEKHPELQEMYMDGCEGDASL